MELAYASCSQFIPDLSITELPGTILIKYNDGCTPPNRKHIVMTFVTERIQMVQEY